DFDVLSSLLFFFSSRRRHTRFSRDWSSDVCSSDLFFPRQGLHAIVIFGIRGEKRFLQLIAIDENFITQAVEGHRRLENPFIFFRSEERRVGKECRSRWSAAQYRQ